MRASYRVAMILLICLAVLTPAAGAEVIGRNNQEVQGVAEPILDAVLTGFNQGNYSLYAKYFDDTLKDTITEKKFLQVRSKILKDLGNYRSRTYLGFLRKGKTTVALWKGEFDQSPDDVLIKLVLSRRGGKNEVLGLWFQ